MDGDDVGLPRNGFGVVVREVHAAPSGLGVFIGPFTQGVALGYHIVPRWGGRPVPLLGAEDRCPFWGRKTGAPLGQKTVAPLGAVDVIGSKNYHPARVCGTAHMRLFHCRDSIRCSTFCCISSLS